MHFGKNFKFHPNLHLTDFSLKIFPKYYQEINYRWSKYLSSPPFVLSSIASKFLWLNKNIQRDNKCEIFSNFSKTGINFVGQLSDSDGKLHCLEFLKEKYILSQNRKLKWFQLIHAIPRKRKEAISMHDASPENLLIQDHHFIKKNQILYLTKLNSNELYKKHIATIDTTIHVFQYKLLNNVLFLNKMLYKLGILQDLLCSFCSLEEETPIHIFYSYSYLQNLCEKLKYYIQNNLDLSSLIS